MPTSFSRILKINLFNIFLVIALFFILPVRVRINVCLDGANFFSTFSGVSSRPVTYDCRILNLGIDPYQTPSLRWLLPDSTVRYVLDDAYFSIGFFHFPLLPADGFLAGEEGTLVFREAQTGVELSVRSVNTDQKIIVNTGRPRRVFWIQGMIALLMGLAARLVYEVGARFLESLPRVGAVGKLLLDWGEWFGEQKFRFREFMSYMAIAALLGLYTLANFSISIDDEMSALRQLGGVWLTEDRWTAFLLEEFLITQPVVPYFTSLLLMVSLVISYMLLVRVHRLNQDWRDYFMFSLYFLFPTWAMIGEFYGNLPAISAGILLTVFAGFLFANPPRQGKFFLLLWGAAQILLLAVAIGAYQTFLFFYIAIGLGGVWLQTWDLGDFPASWFKSILGLGSISLGSLVVHYFFNFVTCQAAQVVCGERIHPLFQSTDATFLRLESLLLSVTDSFSLMRAYYLGQEDKYGLTLSGIPFLVFAVGFVLFVRFREKPFIASVRMIALTFAVLATPFLLQFVFPRELPLRSLFALPYVLWLFLAILKSSHHRFFNQGVFGVLVLVLLFQFLQVHSLYNAASFVTQQFDRNTAYALYERMYALHEPDSAPEEFWIDVYGAIPFRSIYSLPSGSTQGASIFQFANHDQDIWRVVNYMRLMGYSNVLPVPTAYRQSFNSYFQSMPAWPHPGAVRYENGIFLIKLSDTPDPIHVPSHP